MKGKTGNWVIRRPISCLNHNIPGGTAASELPQVGVSIIHGQYVKMSFEYYLRLTTRSFGQQGAGATQRLHR